MMNGKKSNLEGKISDLRMNRATGSMETNCRYKTGHYLRGMARSEKVCGRRGSNTRIIHPNQRVEHLDSLLCAGYKLCLASISASFRVLAHKDG